MKIGIIGTGNMGRALGQRWAANGHEVFLARATGPRRRPSRPKAANRREAGISTKLPRSAR